MTSAEYRDVLDRSEDVNIWGSCSGGITMSAFLAHLAARGETLDGCRAYLGGGLVAGV
jgi:hypothetical protein